VALASLPNTDEVLIWLKGGGTSSNFLQETEMNTQAVKTIEFNKEMPRKVITIFLRVNAIVFAEVGLKV
jgi:hypothetical protein